MPEAAKTQDRPFFSVVVPVYNRAHLLEAALASVRAQSCQDFEIIVVDDGSRDNPAGVVDALRDPRIRLIRQPNGGGGRARNAGFDAARGEFVATLDSDDQFLPHHLATMKSLLAGTTDAAGYARVIVDRGDGVTFLKPPRAIAPDENMATYLLCDRGFVQTSTVVVPTTFAKRVRHPEQLRAAEDTDFAIRLALAGCRFVMAEEPGAIWRDNYSPERLSDAKVNDTPEILDWIDGLRPQIPKKAYLGCLGWPYAKYIAQTSRLKALRHYLTAVFHGCYSPRLAIIIGMQIFLSRRLYRFIADTGIAKFRVGFRLPSKSGPDRLERA